MKRIFVSAMALVMLAGCASKPTTTETPVASAQATTTPEAVDVLTAYRSAWENSEMSEHQFLLEYNGDKELFPLLSGEEVKEKGVCDGVDQAVIDADVAKRTESLAVLYEAVTNFIQTAELVEVEEQKLSDADMLFRLDIKSSANGRYSMAFYNGGYVCIRQVLPLVTGWYQIDEASIASLKDVIDNGYVLITEENKDQLTCWELATLESMLAAA